LFKVKFFISGNLVSVSNLTNNSYRHLRTKIKLFANIVIANTMDFYHRGGLILKSYLGDKVASIIICFNSFKKNISLFLVGNKFNFNRQLHIEAVYHILKKEASQFLRPAKDRSVSLANTI